MLRGRRGFTLLEVVVVTLLIGVVASFAIPRALKTSPQQEVLRAARALTRGLELVRTQAMASKRQVRVTFDAANGFYTAYMDVTGGRTGDIAGTSEEVHATRILSRGSHGGIPGVELSDRVRFSTGEAGQGPLGDPAEDPVQLTDDRVEFNSRGMVTPLGTNGVIFLSHKEDPSVVAAVTISGAGSFQAWRYRNGSWER